MGHAILARGKGRANMVQATLHFGGTHGHEHYDTLNLILFAKDRELIAETRYREKDITNTTREWHTSTAGHATVVVDGHNQTSRQSPHTIKRSKQKTDAVPGVTDWTWRWRGHGNAMNDGMLRLYSVDFPDVQIVEADGERSYGTRVPLKQYRRTIALVRFGKDECYVVDIFRVKGGKVHDFMLHSCLDVPHTSTASVALTKRLRGKLHKYIANAMQGRTDKGWTVDFAMDDGAAGLKTFVLPQKRTTVIRGDGPAMRRQGTAPFYAIRQSDGDSLFVCVHHPYKGKPLVGKVELIPLARGGKKDVVIRVTLPGRVDTIVSTVDGGAVKSRDGKLIARTRFGLAAVGTGRDNWVYMVDGDHFEADGRRVEGKTSYAGTLTKTWRVEAGAKFDAFGTRAGLPVGRRLAGRTLMVDEAGLLVQSFEISKVAREGAQTVIHSADEPGMTITPKLIKLEYYPCWGIQGKARFRIAGSALLRRGKGDAWTFRSTGKGKAAVGRRSVKQTDR